ncbi:MAG: adenylyl-sulfate kinase, partial [Nitrospinota bacterium]
VSALHGANIVKKSSNMPWYDGPTLLHVLEHVHVSSDLNLLDFRFPVQHVLRPDQNFRGYAGKITSGTITPGEEIVVLPSGKNSKVKSLVTMDGEITEGVAPHSYVLTLEDDIDISRGDMIVRKSNLPQVARHFDALLCWMEDVPLKIGKNYLVKHTTKTVTAFISRLLYSIDVNNLHRKNSKTLKLNDIGRVEMQLTQPIMFDYYDKNRETGSFIVIDPETNFTVGAGMIRGVVSDIDETLKSENVAAGVFNKSTNVTRERASVSLSMREERNKHKAAIIWLTGLSGSGKSTIAKKLEKTLFDKGCMTGLLDGDNLRHGLCKDLGFSVGDRSENIRRVSEVGKVLFEHGAIVICTFISPLREKREQARFLVPGGSFFEVFVHCSLKTCINRDPKGLYKKAIDGQIPDFTGISAPYEEPLSPEVVLNTENTSVEECVDAVLQKLREKGILGEMCSK